MGQKNNKQDSIIFEIEELLNKMSNQVNFLIRKEIDMNQLDVDLLMENTRKLYDTICSVELGGEEVEEGLEGGEGFEDDEESADMIWDFTIDNEELGVRSEELGVRSEELEVEELGVEENTDDDDDTDSELIDSSTDRLIDSSTDRPIDSSTDRPIDSSTDRPIDLSTDRPIDSISVPVSEEDSGIRTYRIVRDNNVHTLGDILEKTEDNSLVARLQRKPVSDLISAIGINDKFLFLNELFGGSMEKYNKSIRSLNGFSTLLGAKTYMSELQIEFQWDCDSDAYKKLADLVERRFIPIHNA